MFRRTPALFAALLGAFAPLAAAQGFPTKPIEFVTHSSPGGGADLVARVIADIVAREKLLPQPLIVQNRAGGGGTIAMNYVVGKRADPYVLHSVAVTVMLSVPVRTGLDIGYDKFHMLGLIGFDLNALTVNVDSPFKTAQDLVNAAKAKPKSINVAVGSIGATAHHFIYQLERMTGARFNTVSTKSGADAAVQVLGGHVHATAENVSEMMGHVEAGKLRFLGVPANARLAALPDTPTMKEQGYDLHVGSGRAVASPAGIPRDAAQIYEEMVAKVYKSAGWRDYMRRNQYEEAYMNAEQTTRYMAARQAEIARFLAEVGLAQPPKK
jgi:tripartite-type tricarboxylate transporter receptor subunit TctC